MNGNKSIAAPLKGNHSTVAKPTSMGMLANRTAIDVASEFPDLKGIQAGLIARKTLDLMSKGEALTIMCVGESGLGKSTLINNLFSRDLEKSAAENFLPTLCIVEKEVEFVVDGVPFAVRLVDSPGFGDVIDVNQSFETIVEYLDREYEKMYIAELDAKRSSKPPKFHGVDVVLYFIAPHRLKGLDIALLKRLNGRCTIIPILAKSDTMTFSERLTFKDVVKQQLEANRIVYFHEPLCIISSPSLVESKASGSKVFGRAYEWGTVESELHSEITTLRSLIIGPGLEDLQALKQEYYETYRQRALQREKRSPLESFRNAVFGMLLGAGLVIALQKNLFGFLWRAIDEVKEHAGPTVRAIEEQVPKTGKEVKEGLSHAKRSVERGAQQGKHAIEKAIPQSKRAAEKAKEDAKRKAEDEKKGGFWFFGK
eukprot:CAMPEP_0184699430 /NCGR_PEP_ID=MMETSP0313-20130426/5705_1 /TAXON_ID=2792 /ORGANISM="Porphyridium aerugineum, Strain SAG 1380-2" /LENGTH=425 /DNA_ID=CAMNT_0027158523 /DNA_START=417 /DNA_END=1694 /DNA_ORIENTATION=+